LSVGTSGGYARLVLRFTEEVEAQVRMSNGILVISFKRPVDVAVDRVVSGSADLVTAARRDPDGRAIRIALSRKVIINTITAGERLFIDLLPETWSNELPGLPREVIEELTERTRNAERAARQQQQLLLAQKHNVPPIRVRVAQLPTFTRYVFELPGLIGVTTDRGKDELSLVFAGSVKFDLADAKLSSPPAVAAIEAQPQPNSMMVRFAFRSSVDIRTFREDTNFVVDVSPVVAKPAREDVEGKPGEPLQATATENSPVELDSQETAPVQSDVAAPSVPPSVTNAPSKSPAPPVTPNEENRVDQQDSNQSASAPSPPAKPQASEVAPPSATLPQTSAATPTTPAQPQATGNAAPSAVPSAAPPQSSAATPTAPAQPQVSEPARNSAEENPPQNSLRPVVVELKRQGDNLRLTFPFTQSTPAAVFQRADTMWLVFDTTAKIDIAPLNAAVGRVLRSATVDVTDERQVVRLKLERPQLASLSANGSSWTATIGDAVVEPSKPIGVNRSIIGPSRASITFAIDDPRRLHRIVDPEIGDVIFVITTLAPARGIPKPQEFVEFRVLASTHGVAVQPLADDLNAELSVDKVVLSRPGGLSLSSTTGISGSRASLGHGIVFDTQLWSLDQKGDFNERQIDLIRTAAAAPSARRTAPRLNLARFYLARAMFTEAKGVLDVTLADERPTAEDTAALVLHAIVNIMLDRADGGLKDLANPLVGNQNDAQLWRAIAHARQGKWAEAVNGFRQVEMAMATLPIEMQQRTLKDFLHALIEIGDFSTAANKLNDFEAIGVPREMDAEVSVLTGRVAEGLGRPEDALEAYRAATGSLDQPTAMQARLRAITLLYKLGETKKADIVSDLETLTTIWRGDETEIQALQMLSRLYTEEDRYRDAFTIMRTAMIAHSGSEVTRRIQDEAAKTFNTLFLIGKGDGLPAIDALSLFYDFRDLVPIGRHGDEMIRRLADRLVSVDLLDQAAELLQHQVDNRLQGAARAQVATRLAVIYLLNRRPEKAQTILRATRTANLSNEIRNQRILLEARALSDIGRHDLALEVVANIDGREAIRLRSDILWAARRWQRAAEQIELLYGERWRDFQPLTNSERADIMRAGIGFALGEDAIGIVRLREKYAAKMVEGVDRRSFEVITGGLGTSSAEFRAVVRGVASVDTLDSFLREMRSRYPEIGAFSTPSSPPAVDGPGLPASQTSPNTTGSVSSAASSQASVF
jgi:tetratricopeptide (TPR) repeat protein